MINSDKCQSGLQFLLNKYNFNIDAKLNCSDLSLNINEESFSLLPWRNERRFIELENLVNDGTLEGISAMRVCRIDSIDTELRSLIYRELDLCEWILGSKIVSIFAVENGKKAANIIAKMESGIICTIEVATTLSPNAKTIDKHEIISQRGTACDRVVDTQVPQESIYVFNDNGETDTFLDVDFELFDFNIEEASIVRQSFETIKNPGLREKLTVSANHISEVTDLSIQSAKHSKLMSYVGGEN